MKRYAAVLIAIAGLLAGGQVRSQTNNTPPPMGHYGGRGMSPDERFNKLSEKLNLNDDQKAKVRATFEDTRQKIQAAIEEARSNADTQLQTVLSPEQYQKLQSLWQQHGPHGGNSGGHTNENSAK